MTARDVLLAVRPRQAEALRDELRALPKDTLAASGAVHFARLTVLDGRPREGEAVLLVAVVFDGGDAELATLLAPLTSVWRYCAGYVPDPRRFADWITEHALTPPYSERCYQEPVARVRRAVALRRGLGDLAFDVQSEADPAVVFARFAAFSETHG